MVRSLLRTVFFLAIGLGVGAGLGLFLGWVAWPTEFTEADPAILDQAYRSDYTLMIATTYSQDRNLAAARQRLASLDEDGDGLDWLLSMTVNHILNDEEEQEVRRLVRLATDLGLSSPAMERYLPLPPAGTGGG